MGLSHEHAESKILEKIQIYILTRAELLFTLCLETPCSTICLWLLFVTFPLQTINVWQKMELAATLGHHTNMKWYITQIGSRIILYRMGLFEICILMVATACKVNGIVVMLEGSIALSLCTRFSNFGFRSLFQTWKKIEFKTNLIFFRVWTWFLLPV